MSSIYSIMTDLMNAGRKRYGLTEKLSVPALTAYVEAEAATVTESLVPYIEKTATTLEVPDCIENIGDYAFSYYPELTTVKIPSSVKSISSVAFVGCPKLETITCDFFEENVSGAPWGATDATIHYSNAYLTFTAVEAGAEIELVIDSNIDTSTTRLQYRTDKTAEFVDYTPSVSTQGDGLITLVNKGDYVQFRNLDNTLPSGSRFCSLANKQIAASGSMSSMLNGGSLYERCFDSLFFGLYQLTTAPTLPHTTLADYCYYQMFYQCSALKEIPALPAKTLAPSCYERMFSYCTSLQSVDTLPATTPAAHCYAQMFEGCTQLRDVFGIDLTELAIGSFAKMFKDCAKLSYITVFLDTWDTTYSDDWVSGVAATGHFGASLDVIDAVGKGVDAIPEGWTTQRPSYPSYQVISNPLTFTAEEAGSTIRYDGTHAKSIQYRTNSMSKFMPLPYTTTIELANVGDYVQFQNREDTLPEYYNQFVMTGTIAASGNIQSMLNGREDCVESCYSQLFMNCHSLTQAPELPATTLAYECYSQMFYNCTSLIQAPELPATTLTPHCYWYMFYNCTSLTQAPELPATTLALYCYSHMFYNCTSLTQAPELPATTLDYYCYEYMFRGCTSLTQAPDLPATTLFNYCYYGMFLYCSSLAQAPDLPANALADSCYYNMFYGCTSLTRAPYLPATTLADSCYWGMFRGCSNLTNISVAFTNWPAIATSVWVVDVASSGTFTCPAELPEEFGTSRIPEGWTVERK